MRCSAAYQEAQSLLLNLHQVATATSADFTISSQQSLWQPPRPCPRR